MPRHARIHAPGAIVHVISRFVNREHRIDGPNARRAVLQRIARALTQTDWKLIAYAVMSNHMHLAMIAGDRPASTYLRSLQTSVAQWLNRAQQRIGPVFAGRPQTIIVPDSRGAELVAYIHNNPVRAGVVHVAAASNWSSHAAFIDDAPAAAWLEVEHALRRLGFETSSRGRASFDAFVRERAGDAPAPLSTESAIRTHRRNVRSRVALPLEVSSPIVLDDGASTELVHLGPALVAPRWSGDIEEVLRAVCRSRAVLRSELCSRSRIRRIVDARRLAVATATFALRRNVNEIASALGIAANTASMLLRDAARVRDEANRLAQKLVAEGNAVAPSSVRERTARS